VSNGNNGVDLSKYKTSWCYYLYILSMTLTWFYIEYKVGLNHLVTIITEYRLWNITEYAMN